MSDRSRSGSFKRLLRRLVGITASVFAMSAVASTASANLAHSDGLLDWQSLSSLCAAATKCAAPSDQTQQKSLASVQTYCALIDAPVGTWEKTAVPTASDFAF
ncbi:MAG TPA: hypothetical protein VLA14_07840, partial [Polyangia bacterium]|nr:hypothetical protein [Polyangia bacterium]